jgi:hypothetical protein
MSGDVVVTEFEIRERVDGDWKPLPHCGSWLTDRFYTDDLIGREAAEAALARVAAAVPGDYRVFVVRSWVRESRVFREVSEADDWPGDEDEDPVEDDGPCPCGRSHTRGEHGVVA